MSEQAGDEASTGSGNPLRKRYMFKIGAAILIVALVLAVLGVYTLTEVQASVESDVEETLGSASEREAAGVTDFIAEHNSEARSLSSAREGLADSSDEEIREILEEAAELGDTIEEVHYYNMESGIVEVSTDQLGIEGRSAGERPWGVGPDAFESADDVQSFEPYEENLENVLGFTSPVEGSPNHAVVVVVNIEDRGDLLTSPVQDGYIQVVSHSTGNIVIDPDPDRVSRQHGLVGVLDVITEGTTETRFDRVEASIDEVDDDDLFVTTAPVEGKAWSVVTMAPSDSVLGTVSEVQQSLIILIGVALLALLVVGALITRDINSSLDEMTGYAEEIESGNLDVEIDQSRQDEFGQVSKLFARIRDSLRAQIDEAEAAEKQAEVARAEAEEMATTLQETAEEYSAVMQQVGAGDMTQRMEADSGEESMDQIAAEFNEMIDELEKTTGQLKSYVDEVEEAGAEVEQSSMTVRKASEQVAESIQKISDDAYTQKDRLEATIERMATLADEVEEIGQRTETSVDETVAAIREIHEEMDEIATLSQQTMAESEEVAGAAQEQAAELNTVSERAGDLQRYAQPLRDILNRFETESEHEFVFSVGPTGGAQSPDDRGDD